METADFILSYLNQIYLLIHRANLTSGRAKHWIWTTNPPVLILVDLIQCISIFAFHTVLIKAQLNASAVTKIIRLTMYKSMTKAILEFYNEYFSLISFHVFFTFNVVLYVSFCSLWKKLSQKNDRDANEVIKILCLKLVFLCS